MTVRFLLAALLAAVGSSFFGTASADAVVVDSDTVEYAVSVEAPSGTSIVLHALDPGSEQVTVAMLETSTGSYHTRFESRPLDYIIVFEDLTSGEQSDPLRLSELGVPPEFVGGSRASTVPDDDGADTSLIWLASALALASLSALAFWVLGGDRRPEGEHLESDESVEGAPTEP